MLRRLYLLLPDPKHAEQVSADLGNSTIKPKQLHAVVQEDIKIRGIDDVHRIGEPDKEYLLEWWLWRINLAVFFIALVAATLMIWAPSFWLILPIAIMIGTFSSGFYFVRRIPNVHLNEFSSAVSHGEVVVMVDLPVSQVADIGRYVQRRHPEAVIGGVSWHF
jgi:hypothetical protein